MSLLCRFTGRGPLEPEVEEEGQEGPQQIDSSSRCELRFAGFADPELKLAFFAAAFFAAAFAFASSSFFFTDAFTASFFASCFAAFFA